MKRTTFCLAMCISFPVAHTCAQPVAADSADPLGVQCQMRRECVQMASKDGETTLAVEMRVGRYDVTERNIDWVRENCNRLRESCARMAPSMRYRYPECLVIEEFDARRAGDFTTRAMLYEQGYSRERAISRVKGTPQSMREILSPFDTLLFTAKHAWDSYLMVSYGMVGAERRGFPWGVHLKKVGDRYWLTEESGEGNLSSIIHPIRAPYFRDDATVLPQPPVDMVRLKLSLDKDSPIEKRDRSLKLETLKDDVAEDSTVVVLYIRPVFENGHTPLLQSDTKSLDAPSAGLKFCLEAYNEEDPTIRELVDLWAPEAQKGVETNLHLLSDANTPLNSRFFGFGNQIDEVRPIARVETEDGIVWYVQHPDMIINMKAKVGQGRITWGTDFATVIQRNINGVYKLAHRLEYSAVSDILTSRQIALHIWKMSKASPAANGD